MLNSKDAQNNRQISFPKSAIEFHSKNYTNVSEILIIIIIILVFHSH